MPADTFVAEEGALGKGVLLQGDDGTDRHNVAVDANGYLQVDIAAESAEVEFIEYRLARGCGVNSFYILTGGLSALKEAVGNAAEFLKGRGSLLAYRIISGPDVQVFRWMMSSLCNC